MIEGDKICPNCIEPLIKQRKKLGISSTWLVCPKCGLRTKTTSVDNENEYNFDNLINTIFETNETGGKKQIQP